MQLEESGTCHMSGTQCKPQAFKGVGHLPSEVYGEDQVGKCTGAQQGRIAGYSRRFWGWLVVPLVSAIFSVKWR